MSGMAFHEERFRRGQGQGARAAGRSGARRSSNWRAATKSATPLGLTPGGATTSAYGIRRADDLAAVVAFFEARNGRLHGFRFKDWADHRSCLPSGTPRSPLDQTLRHGERRRATAFPLVKRYASRGAVLDAAASRSRWRGRCASRRAASSNPPAGRSTRRPGSSPSARRPPPASPDRRGLRVRRARPLRQRRARRRPSDLERLGSITSIPLLEIRR